LLLGKCHAWCYEEVTRFDATAISFVLPASCITC
jgi:hypothetical protein